MYAFTRLTATLRALGAANNLILPETKTQALKYLDSNPDYHVEMVHFTLALYYYGCIHLPSAPTHQRTCIFLRDLILKFFETKLKSPTRSGLTNLESLL
jgi:hypothetical protein